jgi:hypothetical protein
MPQGPLLSFESTAFPVMEGEDQETNPGIIGKALAEWLAGELGHRGIPTQGVIAEDFGWCVAVASEASKLYVACANVEDKATAWQVFVFAEGGFFKRLLGKDVSGAALAGLHANVKDILSGNPGIERLREEHDKR